MQKYQKQETLWNTAPTFDNMYLAVPGFSEHHTGLALDISNLEDGLTKNNNKTYEYLRNNAHKFGFILRYPKGKEWITGYAYEPWHYRFVGIDAAKIIYEEGLTFEEYHAKYKSVNEFRQCENKHVGNRNELET